MAALSLTTPAVAMLSSTTPALALLSLTTINAELQCDITQRVDLSSRFDLETA